MKQSLWHDNRGILKMSSLSALCETTDKPNLTQRRKGAKKALTRDLSVSDICYVCRDVWVLFRSPRGYSHPWVATRSVLPRWPMHAAKIPSNAAMTHWQPVLT